MVFLIAIFTNLYMDKPYLFFNLSRAIANDSLINKVCLSEIQFLFLIYTFIFSAFTSSFIETLINLLTDTSYLLSKSFLNSSYKLLSIPIVFLISFYLLKNLSNAPILAPHPFNHTIIRNSF